LERTETKQLVKLLEQLWKWKVKKHPLEQLENERKVKRTKWKVKHQYQFVDNKSLIEFPRVSHLHSQKTPLKT
jgi:hypothetical protein